MRGAAIEHVGIDALAIEEVPQLAHLGRYGPGRERSFDRSLGMGETQQVREVDSHPVARAGALVAFLRETLGFVEDVRVVSVDEHARHANSKRLVA